MELDREFINKRIEEQKRYIYKISISNLPAERKKEVIDSATKVKHYFENMNTEEELYSTLGVIFAAVVLILLIFNS